MLALAQFPPTSQSMLTFFITTNFIGVLRPMVAEIQEQFKNNARLKLHQYLEVVCITVYISTFALSIQCFCSVPFFWLYDEVKHHQRFEYTPLNFRISYTFDN